MATSDQIVNIHFARADVKKLKILIGIKKLRTKLKREKALLRLSDKKKDTLEQKRIQRRIDSLKLKITKE
jgi:hypothetical protein